MISFKIRHLTLKGMLLGSLWFGVGYLADHEKETEKLKDYSENIVESIKKLDPFLLASSFSYRLGCGTRGDCLKCQNTSDRIFTVDCGLPVPFNFKDILRGGTIPPQTKPENNYLLGLLSIPGAVLYVLKTVWHAGPLAFLPGISSLVLAYTILLRVKDLNAFFKVYALWFGWMLAALIEYAFQLIVVGVLSHIGAVFVALGYLAFLLSVPELYLKMRDASEFLEENPKSP